MNAQACAIAAEQLAVTYPRLCVIDETGGPMPLSTAMWLRIVLCVVDAYEDAA